MITRATILTGDADSPVVLHVPQCPPAPAAEFTPRMLLDGSLDTVADRIVHHARKQSRRRPHAVLNRLPRYLDDAVPEAEENARRGCRTQLCSHHHVAVATASDPYVALLRGIIDERIAAVGHATVIEIRTMSVAAADPMRIVLGVDTGITPSSLIDAAATAFTGYAIDTCPTSAITRRDESTPAGDSAQVQTLTVTIDSGAVSPSEIHGLGDALATLADGVGSALPAPTKLAPHPHDRPPIRRTSDPRVSYLFTSDPSHLDLQVDITPDSIARFTQTDASRRARSRPGRTLPTVYRGAPRGC
ncbi:hypothetical protein [Gordonia phthalatica]|uniref:Uncharacterized protein n=1 Tax=Gordonia phthalatica TaxID=1136941 RepID=A0A0N9NCD5_9ACTN|nr:hypothetical protein [Gordonia phthalatica]ALG85293.1 hypothetical protein ACH46_13435 [Gordonia phthalatica]